MEATQKTKGIILRREACNENDSRVFVYSQDFGKLELIARGTQKITSKIAAHIEPCNLSEIMIVKGKQYDYIGSAINEEVFFGIKNNYQKSILAGELMKLVNDFVKTDSHERQIFSLLKNFFSIINQENIRFNLAVLKISFLMKFLTIQGFRPELYICAICKVKLQPSGNTFSYERGGVVCAKCKSNESEKISANAIKVLRFLLSEDFSEVAKIIVENNLIKETKGILDNFKKYYID
ncbi:MAG: DNA repair protein RecO [bacterium]|nr:DNA repair protein RecO [bacterium]